MSETLENVVATAAIKEAEEAAKEEVAIEVQLLLSQKVCSISPKERWEKQYGAFIFYLRYKC